MKIRNQLIDSLLRILKVLEAGLEPARPKAQDFKSGVSTNSTTRASDRAKDGI